MKFTAIFNSLPHLFKISDPYDLGTEITGSRQGNKDLSSEVRAAIWASVKAREKKTGIARRFNIDRSTVNRTMKRFAERHDFKSRPRLGGPRSLSDRGKRYLVQLARRFPNVTWKTLLQMEENSVSESTARKILRRHHIRKCRPRRCPRLRLPHVAKRLEFCYFWKGRKSELASVCKP